MDFIRNINKPFILKPTFNILKETKGIKSSMTQPEMGVKLIELDIHGATFKIIDYPNVDEVVEEVLTKLSEKLIKDVKKIKRIANKVIKEWNEAPENFTPKKGYSKTVYLNKDLLSDNDYRHSVSYYFDNLSEYYHDLTFTTGNGGDTHYEKEYYINGIKEIDIWLEKQLKLFKSTKIKKRVKNYLNKTVFELEMHEILKHIEIKRTRSTSKKEVIAKPPFPIVFRGSELNSLLFAYDSGELVFDEIYIEIFQEEFGLDISSLTDWEINISYKGEHHNDGQIVDYTVEFMSPDGHTYYAYDSHCLMTGWDFSGTVIIG